MSGNSLAPFPVEPEISEPIPTPWFKSYPADLPHSLEPYPNRTLLEMVREAGRQRPNHPVLIFYGNQIDYGALNEMVDAFAAVLHAYGVRKGDRLALLLPNCPQMVIAQLAAWAIGAVVCPLNPLYSPSELIHTLNEAGAQTVVVLTPFYDKLKTLQSQTNIRTIIVAQIKSYLPLVTKWLFSLAKEKKEGHIINLQAGDLLWDDLLGKFKGVRPPVVDVSLHDPAVLMFSGGTSGIPKAAVGTHRALLCTGWQIHAWFKHLLIDWDDAIMLTMPLFHTYGNIGVLCTGLVGHNRLVLMPNPRDLNHVLQTIHKTRPAFLPGVPTFFIALLNHPNVQAGKVDFSSIKLCISGAAPLMEETKKRFENITGGKMIEAYALTETMCGAVLSPVGGVYKPGSVGIPSPDMIVRIVDADAGQRNLPIGEVGEILLKAPNLMAEYWHRPDETAETIRDGWLYTGDLGYLDEDGYLMIVDRKKDVIKPGGFQVWPREVEEVIAAHPAVMEVGVAGIPDPYQTEAVKAWIVLRPDQLVSEEDLQTWCRQRLVGYKVPHYIEFRDSLPKSTVGKVLRRELTRSSDRFARS